MTNTELFLIDLPWDNPNLFPSNAMLLMYINKCVITDSDDAESEYRGSHISNQCNLCGKSFSRSRDVKRHLKNKICTKEKQGILLRPTLYNIKELCKMCVVMDIYFLRPVVNGSLRG